MLLRLDVGGGGLVKRRRSSRGMAVWRSCCQWVVGECLVLCTFVLSALALLTRSSGMANVLRTSEISFPNKGYRVCHLCLGSGSLSRAPFSIGHPSRFLSRHSVSQHGHRNVPMSLASLPITPTCRGRIARTNVRVIKGDG